MISVALVLVVVAAAWLVMPSLRRAEPLDQRMPRVGANDAASVDAMLKDLHSTAATTSRSATGGETRSADQSTNGPGGVGDSGSEQGDDKTGGPERLTVHVAGAVASPGVVELANGSRVVDAIAAAGGLRPDSDPDRLNLAASLTDAMKVFVPIMGQAVPLEAPIEGSSTSPKTQSSTPKSSSSGGSGKGGGSGGAPVDVNTADASELQGLPGVGPATADAIVAKRTSDGPFKSVEDLLDVRGIGDAKLEAMRDLVRVG